MQAMVLAQAALRAIHMLPESSSELPSKWSDDLPSSWPALSALLLRAMDAAEAHTVEMRGVVAPEPRRRVAEALVA